MSSLIMHEPLAIRMQNVSKIYKLHGSQSDQLIDVLGLQRFGFKTKTQAKEFAALRDISLAVPRGHRIGIIGRNGAGKTTLLKLICGNFAPTQGEIAVNGSVQALMNIGLGFHPEYTGRENVEASLQYNGLGRDQYQTAMEGIISFCELEDFLDQPFKTYSLGMQARLMFAAATAIRPDILIVDEVLGAGDAYFVAKSKQRVEKLVSSGCTMLLVSHSMQQILELCDEAIWLEKGRIRMQDEAFLVVKAYEDHMHGPIGQLRLPTPGEVEGVEGESVRSQTPAFDGPATIRGGNAANHAQLQEPYFLSHSKAIEISDDVAQTEMQFIARGGLSRWQSQKGVKVCGFSIATNDGATNKLYSLTPAKIIIHLIAEETTTLRCRYGIVINDSMGRNVSIIYSPIDTFQTRIGEMRKVVMGLNPLQLGAGEYTIGISVLDATELERVNLAKRYDLLGRSFEFSVEIPDSLSALNALVFHSAEWTFSQ